MRVLTALTYYHPHWTGLTGFARSIAEGMVERGHDVTVLTSWHDRSVPELDVVGGVRVRRIAPWGRLSRTMVMPGYPAAVWRALADHDVLHVHSPMPEAGVLVAMARGRGVRSVITHQGDVVMPTGGFNRVVQAAMAVTSSAAFRHADAVVTHNHDYAAHSRALAEVPGGVGAIVPPVVLPPARPGASAAWRRDLGLCARPVIGFAGRFVEEKGFDVLLAAVPHILAELPDAVLLFAGETDVVYEDSFERCRATWEARPDAVRTVGLVRDRQRLAEFYGLCDVFVLPSRSDCFAAVQVEALLSGTRVVATDIPGARTVIETTGLGRLVPPDDARALAAGVVAELRAGHPRHRRDAVAAVYDTELALDRYEALLAGETRPDTIGPGPVVRADARWRSPPSDGPRLERLLANEADMAFRRRVPRLFELLELTTSDRVLDAGSGMGVLSMMMRRVRDVEVTALDGDLDRLRWAQRERVPAGLVRGDLVRLPFADATFDKVLLAEVLEHLDDDVAALVELARVLRPGGVLAISVPHANYPWAWDPINRTLETFGLAPIRAAGPITGQWSNHQRLYLPAQLARVIRAAGLRVDTVECQTAHAAPFNHLLVYGIGKPLIEHDLLPARLRNSADRFHGDRNRIGFDPVGLAVSCLRRYDRRNDRLTGREVRFAGIVARAVKT